MNKKFFIFVLLAAGVILLASSLTLRSQITAPVNYSPSPTSETSTPNSETPEQYAVTVSLDFGNGKIEKDEVVLKKPSTAYDALMVFVQTKDLKINTKQYDFGAFVESINGFESNKDKAWIYYVNGKSGSIAADKQGVVENDLVEWKYITPAAE